MSEIVFKRYPNKLSDSLPGNRYTHYELLSVREYEDVSGVRFFEAVTPDTDLSGNDTPSGTPCSPVLVGLYGRLREGEAQHIADFKTLKAAREMLLRMGVIESSAVGHTPGPWGADDAGFIRLDDQLEECRRDLGTDDEWVPVVIYDEDGPSAVVALCHPRNARLVAAAPELLMALEEMVIANHGLPMNSADEHDLVRRAALERARVVLAKAEECET